MDFNKISNPEQLLEFMGQNIKYGFARKNGELCISQEPEEWNDCMSNVLSKLVNKY